MFNSGILDVAIGIVFIYLLVSLIVSAVNELCAALLKMRGRVRWQGISNLLPADEKENYAKKVYDHPLIGGLARINRLPDELQRPLRLLFDEARHDLEHFRTAVEVWYNDSMDRVGGVYKRRVQYALFGFGLFFAISLNVDTIVLANRLSHDSALRAALVSNAEAAAKLPPPPAAAENQTVPEQNAALTGTIAQLDQLRLPIGWSGPGDDLTPALGRLGWFGGLLDAVRRHLLGWVLTAFAATLGAPFWFDLLNRFTSIRSAGKAPEERPKDPKVIPQPAAPGDSPEPATAFEETGETP